MSDSDIQNRYWVPISMITVTEDTLRLKVLKLDIAIKQRSSVFLKLTSSGSFFVTLLLSTLTTSTFKNVLGISPSVWEAIVYIGLVISFACFIFNIYKAFTLPNIPDLVTDLIQESKELQKTKSAKPSIDLNCSSDWLTNPIPAEFRERAKKQHEKQPQ